MNSFDTAAIPPQVMTREMGDETVILDLNSGTYFSLNPVGARFWELAGQGLTLGGICDRILAEYDVERGQLETDLRRLADELCEKSLLIVRPTAQ